MASKKVVPAHEWVVKQLSHKVSTLIKLNGNLHRIAAFGVVAGDFRLLTKQLMDTVVPPKYLGEVIASLEEMHDRIGERRGLGQVKARLTKTIRSLQRRQ
jgi:hypothetical protein